MNALLVMDTHQKDVSTLKNDIKVQYLYDNTLESGE